MIARSYRGQEITRSAGWYNAHVLEPRGRYYVNVHADTVHGCRQMIADVLNGVNS
jgi:hypothetical protein